MANPYPAWRYYDNYTITNNIGSGYQGYIVIPWKTGINNDFSDLRFSDDQDNTIPYWIKTLNAGSSAQVWIKHAGSSNVLRVHYGNQSAASENNINAVMEFGDDFRTETSLDAVKWPTNLNIFTYSFNNGLKITDAPKNATDNWIYTNAKAGSQIQASWTPNLANYEIEYQIEVSNTASNQMGQVGGALIGADNLLTAYNPICDASVSNQSTCLKFGFVEGAGDIGTVDLANNATRDFRILRGNSNNVYIYQKAPTDTAWTLRAVAAATDISKIGISVGAYGPYPFLNYVKIPYFYVRKYVTVNPTYTYTDTVDTGATTGTNYSREIGFSVSTAKIGTRRVNALNREGNIKVSQIKESSTRVLTSRRSASMSIPAAMTSVLRSLELSRTAGFLVTAPQVHARRAVYQIRKVSVYIPQVKIEAATFVIFLGFNEPLTVDIFQKKRSVDIFQKKRSVDIFQKKRTVTFDP